MYGINTHRAGPGIHQKQLAWIIKNSYLFSYNVQLDIYLIDELNESTLKAFSTTDKEFC